MRKIVFICDNCKVEFVEGINDNENGDFCGGKCFDDMCKKRQERKDLKNRVKAKFANRSLNEHANLIEACADLGLDSHTTTPDYLRYILD